MINNGLNSPNFGMAKLLIKGKYQPKPKELKKMQKVADSIGNKKDVIELEMGADTVIKVANPNLISTPTAKVSFIPDGTFANQPSYVHEVKGKQKEYKMNKVYASKGDAKEQARSLVSEKMASDAVKLSEGALKKVAKEYKNFRADA